MIPTYQTFTFDSAVRVVDLWFHAQTKAMATTPQGDQLAADAIAWLIDNGHDSIFTKEFKQAMVGASALDAFRAGEILLVDGTVGEA